jgi:hypothetical protein
MSEIKVEPGGVRSRACPECAGMAAVAHGYVYANDDPCAVYFVDWCERHGERRRAFVTITLGDWDGGSTGAERSAVCVEVGADGMALTEQPFRDRPVFFGRFRPGSAVLRSGGAFAGWQLVDRILADDPLAAAVLCWVRSGSAAVLPAAGGQAR